LSEADKAVLNLVMHFQQAFLL